MLGNLKCCILPSAEVWILKRFYNFAGHFLLTDLVLDTMKTTALESNREGRIVIVSSEAHRFAYSEGIRFDKINDESG
jgi:WW domain-containing oxidoreductase